MQIEGGYTYPSNQILIVLSAVDRRVRHRMVHKVLIVASSRCTSVGPVAVACAEGVDRAIVVREKNLASCVSMWERDLPERSVR
jgi:hypothetical protein